MAEYINKAEAKEIARKVISELCADDGNRVVAEINAFAGLNKLPTIDIVRCCECIHAEENIKKYRPNTPLTWICKGRGIDGFCSDGERKE